MMKNRDIAEIFEKTSYLLEIRGDNIHRVLSYRRAAENILAHGRELTEMHTAGEKLTSISGIGQTLADKIVEIITTGELDFYNRVAAEIPPSLLDLMRVDGLGPKRIKLIYEQLGVTTIEGLAEAAERGDLRQLPKMGAKSEEKILRNIRALQKFGDGRHPLGDALPLAKQILADLAQLTGVRHTAVGGSARRYRDTVGDLDLLVAADEANAPAVMDAFCTHELAEEVAQRGPTKSRIVLPNGLGADLRVLPPQNWGTLLNYFTGSQAHNVRLRELAQKQGLSLNEYSFTNTETGEEIICETEEAVYQTLNLPYIVPPLREDRGEIEAAQRGELPQLVQQSDLIADLHMHTTWSDGKLSVLEMAQEAKRRGYKYIAITDHSQSLTIANGLSVERLRQQAQEIAAANEQLGPDFRILHGTEMEIKTDGTLDFPDEVLAELDWVIAALHVGLTQPRAQIMERLMVALHNPHVDMIAHPTGRLLPDRPGADVDMELLLNTAVSTNTILEINANPRRLDLQDSYVRRAVELGVKLAINCDAHHADQFDLLHYGVATAQRGWTTAVQVVNSWPLEQLLQLTMSKEQ